VEKPRGRWKDVVYMLYRQNGKAAARNREGWRKEIGEAMARKQAEAPYKNTLDQTEKLPICTKGMRFFSSPKRPERLWGPTQSPTQRVPGFFPWGKAAGT
jgi:hypothetical protein